MRAPARSILFPLVCALAYAGGTIAYVPLLALLLPLRVEEVAGDARVAVLAAILIAGAVMASGAGILFGWASDRTGGRRAWIAGGFVATMIACGGIVAGRTPIAIGAAVLVWQAALNALLAPLTALIAEEVPDAEKGLMGGLLASAQPLAALSCPLLVALAPAGMGSRLAIVGVIVGTCLAPLLLTMPRAMAGAAVSTPPPAPRRDLAVFWLARLLVQIASSVLFGYLLYVMEGFAPPQDRGGVALRVAHLLVPASLLPLPVALLLGRWSDRLRRRKPFLVAATMLAAAGLATMAAAGAWTIAATGFCLYAVGSAAFLSLQTGFVMESLPDPDRRGRDLGLLNLANTLPSILGPALAWWLAVPRHPAALLLMLATLMLAGGLATLAVRGRR